MSDGLKSAAAILRAFPTNVGRPKTVFKSTFWSQIRAGLCRLYHMGGGPRRQGPPINCQFFTTLCWRSLTTKTTKKVFNFLGEEEQKKSAPREKKSRVGVWEKGPRLTLEWGPRMVNPALSQIALIWHLTLMMRLVSHIDGSVRTLCRVLDVSVSDCAMQLLRWHCMRIISRSVLQYIRNRPPTKLC